MADDAHTNQFIRECVHYAERFANTCQFVASREVLYCARRAMDTRQSPAPFQHYTPELYSAIVSVYGQQQFLADLSIHKQIEALSFWNWYRRWTGSTVPMTIGLAIEAMHSDRPWARRKEMIQHLLDNEPSRLAMRAQSDEELAALI